MLTRLQETLLSSKTQLQMYATLNSVKQNRNNKRCFHQYKGTLTWTCDNKQGILQVVFKACSMHGQSPQNDKQKAQTKLSFHNVSATKTKRESVSLENQNVTELC